jgi:dihydroorotate dehydrogenase
MKKDTRKPVVIKLSPEELRRLERYAASHNLAGVVLGQITRKAVMDFLDHWEGKHGKQQKAAMGSA